MQLPTQEEVAQNTITLKRLARAPREKVYEALTQPELLQKWFAPCPDMKMKFESWDCRPGGRYKVEFTGKDGKARVLGGFFDQTEAAKLLVYIWGWENEDEYFGENKVSWTLRDADGSTEVILDHRFFPDAATLEKHETRWNKVLDRLEQHFS